MLDPALLRRSCKRREPTSSVWSRFATATRDLIPDTWPRSRRLSISASPTAGPGPRPRKAGQFEFIFSVNVIEHCQPLEPNLEGMAGVLSPGGRMLHTCPNYRVPYEPHLRTPLIPAAPGLTARLRPALSEDPVGERSTGLRSAQSAASPDDTTWP